MFKAITFGLCFGAGLQAWRRLPPEHPSNAHAAFVVMLIAVLAAYFAGRLARHRGASATAVAVASANAEATAAAVGNTVNVAVFAPAGPGSSASPVGLRVPDEGIAWFGAPRPAAGPELLDGADPADLAEILGVERSEQDMDGEYED